MRLRGAISVTTPCFSRGMYTHAERGNKDNFLQS